MRANIKRSVLRRMGYRKGATCYFKCRVCRRGTTRVLVQVRAYGDWPRGKAAHIEVNSAEYPIEGRSTLQFEGRDHSEVSTVKHLRDWESFAFQP